MTCACGCGEQTNRGSVWISGHNFRNRPRPRCGTQGGYKAHRRRGESSCAPCRQAHNRACALRSMAGRERTVLVSEWLLGRMLANARTEIRLNAVEAIGRKTVERALRTVGAL